MGVHFGIDIAGCDGIDGDVRRGELQGQCAGEPEHTGLGGGICDFHCRAAHAPNGRDIDDSAGFLADHGAGRALREVNGGGQIRVAQSFPLCGRHGVEKIDERDAGGVDENVNMPEFFFGVRPHALACGGVGKVAADGIGFDAV